MILSIQDLKRVWRPLLAIGAIVALLAGLFAWAMGLVGMRGVTTESLFTEIENNNPHPFPAGFRRAHGKGVCFVGTFHGSGAAADLSKAAAFTRTDLPVVGRFSLGAGDPHATDNASRTLAMAMKITDPAGNQWRLAMNYAPYFVVRKPEGFRAQAIAFRKNKATGQPNPAKVRAFLADYPEAEKFLEWQKTAPWANSWANAEYNGINAFRLVGADGASHFVRWRMRPHAPFVAWSKQDRERASPDHLARELAGRLAQGPLRWDMVLTLARPGDPINDPSQPWPESNPQRVAGTLEVTEIMPNAVGPCRDVNFDPTILPPGIEISDDPVLAARSGAYARSYNLREKDIGFGRATEAVGKGADR